MFKHVKIDVNLDTSELDKVLDVQPLPKYDIYDSDSDDYNILN